VQLADIPSDADRDFFVPLYWHVQVWAGLLAVELDPDSRVLYGCVGTVDPAHRGAGLSRSFAPLMEQMGRAMALGMVYSLAPLETLQVQRSFERAGWQLLGIMLGCDREVIDSGRVQRVSEAICAKPLAASADLHEPDPSGLTPETLPLFRLPYPTRVKDGTAS
jgi:hypothetical protein